MLTVPQIAQVAHQVNMAYCASQGDNSQKTWEEAPEWQRTSAINQVRFHLDNPDAALSHTHDSWMKEKVESGWVYGPQKDENKKTHPCIVPYEDLPIEQKAKYCLFSAVVRTFAVHIKHGSTYYYIAKAVYDITRTYNVFMGEGTKELWEDLTTYDRLSYVDSVVWPMHRSKPYEVENLWNRWVNNHIIHGWTYGSVEDIDKMISPYIVLWDQLSPYKKTAFSILQAIVLALGEITAQEVL